MTNLSEGRSTYNLNDAKELWEKIMKLSEKIGLMGYKILKYIHKQHKKKQIIKFNIIFQRENSFFGYERICEQIHR